MDRDKISVIVPVYNIEAYFERTVESILAQTYDELEIIIVDDGSSDDSGKIADCLAEQDSRIKVLHKSNGGVTAARIDGIRLATGNWIGFVDGDDLIEPEMFDILLQNAKKHSADISHCGYQMVFPSRVDYYYNTQKTVVQDRKQGVYDLLEGSYVEPGLWNKLVRAEIVKNTIKENLVDTSIRINEDLLMNYHFFRQSEKSVYYDRCLYHYMLRKNSAATSGVNKSKLYDPIRVLKLIYEDVGENEILKNVLTARLASLYINGAVMKNPQNEPYIDEYIKMCRKELKSVKPIIAKGNFGRAIKLRCILCTASPLMYKLFHKLYAKARGTDNKYEVR